jgi:hypothetical protein
MSRGVGSKEWLSAPGGSNMVKFTRELPFALSPAIARVKSYGGKIVAITVTLPFALLLSLAPPAKANEQMQISIVRRTYIRFIISSCIEKNTFTVKKFHQRKPQYLVFVRSLLSRIKPDF